MDGMVKYFKEMYQIASNYDVSSFVPALYKKKLEQAMAKREELIKLYKTLSLGQSLIATSRLTRQVLNFSRLVVHTNRSRRLRPAVPVAGGGIHSWQVIGDISFALSLIHI